MSQYECEHGHPHYDGDQGIGNPYDDGWHHAVAGHGRDDVSSWDEWERQAYESGYQGGLTARGEVQP